MFCSHFKPEYWWLFSYDYLAKSVLLLSSILGSQSTYECCVAIFFICWVLMLPYMIISPHRKPLENILKRIIYTSICLISSFRSLSSLLLYLTAPELQSTVFFFPIGFMEIAAFLFMGVPPLTIGIWFLLDYIRPFMKHLKPYLGVSKDAVEVVDEKKSIASCTA
ncbi:uncharacterized protein BJ171DRAFT_489862 [Polychytrium aggregatum]|uniref:uncharacterized protein n=1 Tax=Polychytrium aggregatum TaxID=110093 RepID=UPI0022FE2FC5|nr:uncharacterized protein BJ171DRAFT_489862 [Polychytrium aggregatum]KAI9208748.1 hypothetical protein BJ171DRAFT_489862 [Polychytrium aggregatum]